MRDCSADTHAGLPRSTPRPVVTHPRASRTSTPRLMRHPVRGDRVCAAPLPASLVPCPPRACACVCARAYLHMRVCTRLLARAWTPRPQLLCAPRSIALAHGLVLHPDHVCSMFLPVFLLPRGWVASGPPLSRRWPHSPESCPVDGLQCLPSRPHSCPQLVALSRPQSHFSSSHFLLPLVPTPRPVAPLSPSFPCSPCCSQGMRLAAGTGVWAHVHSKLSAFTLDMNTTNILKHPLSVTKFRVITALQITSQSLAVSS